MIEGLDELAQPVRVDRQRMCAQRRNDFGVDVSHTEIERVAVGKVDGTDLDKGRAEAADDGLRAVGRARIDDDDLPRRQRRCIEDRGQRFADIARLVLGANNH